MLDRRKIRDHRGHHPWRTIGLIPEWSVEFTDDLPPQLLGLTIHRERRVLIPKGLDIAGRRTAICHETGHIIRGDTSACHVLFEESVIEEQTARLLMPAVDTIGHALSWHRASYELAAKDLWVDEQLLNVRLSTLSPGERRWLDEQLATILI